MLISGSASVGLATSLCRRPRHFVCELDSEHPSTPARHQLVAFCMLGRAGGHAGGSVAAVSGHPRACRQHAQLERRAGLLQPHTARRERAAPKKEEIWLSKHVGRVRDELGGMRSSAGEHQQEHQQGNTSRGTPAAPLSTRMKFQMYGDEGEVQEATLDSSPT